MSAVLEPAQRVLLAEARRATLATIGADGRPRLVPCCFALLDSVDGPVLVTPIDEKPKQAHDPRRLARVQDIERDGRVTLLVDRWHEDWTRLAWLRIDGTARLLWPLDAADHAASDAARHVAAVEALRTRYSQYQDHALEQLPIIAITPGRVVGWTAAPTG